MDGAREQLLAGAGLAEQEHRAVGLRDPPRMALHGHSDGTAPTKLAIVYFGRRCAASSRPGIVELALQARELDHQRLHRRVRAVEEHEGEAANHWPDSSRSGSRLTRKLPYWLVSRSMGIARPLSITSPISEFGTTSWMRRPMMPLVEKGPRATKRSIALA